MGIEIREYAGSAEGLTQHGGIFESECISSFARSQGKAPFLRVESAAIGQVGLHRVRSTGHTVALEEHSNFTFLMPRVGSIESEMTTSRTQVSANSIVACRPGSRETTVKPGSSGLFEATVVLFAASQLPQRATLDFSASRAPGSGHPEPRQASDLADTVAFAFHAAERAEPSDRNSKRSNLIAALLVDSANAFFGSFGADNGVPQRNGRSQSVIVRRAERIIANEYFESLSIAEIALRLEVSTRTLQTAFQSVHGISPREFLNGFRMDRAREMLMNTDRSRSITFVALANGFSHFGRFSAAYREKFGELPSETERL